MSEPMGVPGPPQSEQDRIDAALTDLEAAAEQPLDAQIEAAQRVHDLLQRQLSGVSGLTPS